MDHVVVKEAGGKALLLNLNSGAYFEMNRVGLAFFKLCDGRKRKKEIILSMSRKFKMKEEKTEKETKQFFNDLRHNKLVEIVSKPDHAAIKPHKSH